MSHVSVILPTFNRLARLQQVLTALANQSYPLTDFEVLVISDGSTDGTDDYLAQLTTPLRLMPVRQSNQGAAAARNHGLALASGRLILFIDDDVVPAPELIAEHVQCHEQEGGRNAQLVVLGPMLTPADFMMAPWVRWEQEMLYKQYEAMLAEQWQPTARQFYTGNASVARQHLLAVGGFDTAFRRAEDVELAYRLAARGLHFRFNPQAIGYHYAERSFAAWLQTPYQYGRNDVIFTRDKGQPWLLPTIMAEFHGRHPGIKILTKLCISRPQYQKVAQQMLADVAKLGARRGQGKLPQHAYSALFNLTYYQGVTDELGGRQKFLQLVEQASPTHTQARGAIHLSEPIS
ncbi:MAG: glycosyltransferase [Caldilineaceae bacterium]